MLLHQASVMNPSMCSVQVAETSTFTYTCSAPGNGCRGSRGDVESALEPYGLLGNLSFPGHRQEITHLKGSHNLSQPVTDMLGNTTGERCLSSVKITARQGRLWSSPWRGQGSGL